jgi:hypothetical protein
MSALSIRKHVAASDGPPGIVPGRMIGGQVTCIYRAYEDGELVVTGRLTLDDLPSVGDTVPLNGRSYTVRALDYDGGEPVLSLERRP